MIESIFIPEVRWPLRYAPFAVLGSSVCIVSATWLDLSSRMVATADLPGRLVADIVVSATAFGVVGYRIFSYHRKKQLG